MYGGGSASSSGDSDDDNSRDRRDSDNELKVFIINFRSIFFIFYKLQDSIKRRKTEFLRTEREIEDKLAEAESRKQESVTRSPSPETNVNDTQVDAKDQGQYLQLLF